MDRYEANDVAKTTMVPALTVGEQGGHTFKYSISITAAKYGVFWKLLRQVSKSDLGKEVIMAGFLKEVTHKLRLEGQELAKEGELREKRRKNGSR